VKKNTAIIIGGTGQYGITLSHLLIKQRFNVFATSRFNNKINFYNKKYPKIKFIKLSILNNKQIEIVLRKIKPSMIFYFAGQSSPQKSIDKKKETFKSNYEGCKNILNVVYKNNLNLKFLNAASSEMYGHIKGKINLKTPKLPLNPYGEAKKKSFNLVKKYRDEFGMQNYNAVMFNTESYLRDKNFLIAKICIGAIMAFKKKKKLTLNNIIVSREWNWCSEQCNLLLMFLKKKPHDFILSNGKSYSIKQMLIFAFEYFSLNYKDFVTIKFKQLKKSEVKNKKSDYKKYLKQNKITFKSKIFGKKLIHEMIKYYLNKKKINISIL
jgi:GDPmannose 4,6-dehydratase